jgi:hypothetical protein
MPSVELALERALGLAMAELKKQRAVNVKMEDLASCDRATVDLQINATNSGQNGRSNSMLTCGVRSRGFELISLNTVFSSEIEFGASSLLLLITTWANGVWAQFFQQGSNSLGFLIVGSAYIASLRSCLLCLACCSAESLWGKLGSLGLFTLVCDEKTPTISWTLFLVKNIIPKLRLLLCAAVNYVAVSEALQTSSSMVAAGLAADNLICALYFTAVFALAAGIPPDQPDTATSSSPTALPAEEGKGTFTVLEGSTALAVSAAICAVGVRLSKLPALRVLGGGIPCMTAVVVALATVFPKQVGALAPAGEALAVILMQVRAFMAVLTTQVSALFQVTLVKLVPLSCRSFVRVWARLSNSTLGISNGYNRRTYRDFWHKRSLKLQMKLKGSAARHPVQLLHACSIRIQRQRSSE